MELAEHRSLDEGYLVQNYGTRLQMAFVRGEGCWLYDSEGRRYLDWLAGIAVNTLGYGHPRLVEALCEQVRAITHSSNYFYIGPQAKLGRHLVELSGLDRAFFCNSGAEANEALLKLARRWSAAMFGEGVRPGVITFGNSFHGRTLATLTATAQGRIQEGYAPLMPGFKHAPFNDLAAAREAVDETTCAILVEPIQGEGGINPADEAFLKGLRALCDERGLLLLLDEVQCGIGRAGTMFCYEQYGFLPDAVALAKGLGGGVPIGAVVCSQELADQLKPGSHGTTFGGNHLATRAGLTVVETILEDGLLAHVRDVGTRLKAGLDALCERSNLAVSARGRGLMLGLQLAEDRAAALRDACAAEGLIVNAVKPDTVRIVPPLVISADEVDEGLARLERAVAAVG